MAQNCWQGSKTPENEEKLKDLAEKKSYCSVDVEKTLELKKRYCYVSLRCTVLVSISILILCSLNQDR